jgi:rhodanese-related sulfurtransferase
MNELLLNPYSYLNRKDIYYIYCGSGIKSLALCTDLGEQGFNVINVLGGYKRWIIDNE